ncbi:hypothetical protein N784_12360 [Pontibacillus litoralis JSM 072002]|uniref:YqfQ-like protein n=2 Tax=Pontibacillus TaxID=289201 RepID=A0A0A5G449_9BACI|nr:hypothetical protein N784_12360 [Pontibacillus litoralis JSM 072002]
MPPKGMPRFSNQRFQPSEAPFRFNSGMQQPMRMSPFAQTNGFPFQQAMPTSVQGARSGGLLSRLFGGGSTIGNMGPMANATSGLMSGTTSAGGGLTGMLNNVQQGLKLAQTAAPMVQQYGPMIKNAPTMFKLMKLMNEPDEEGTKKEEGTKEQTKSKSPMQKKDSSSKAKVIEASDVTKPHTTSTKQHSGRSQPRLYI